MSNEKKSDDHVRSFPRQFITQKESNYIRKTRYQVFSWFGFTKEGRVAREEEKMLLKTARNFKSRIKLWRLTKVVDQAEERSTIQRFLPVDKGCRLCSCWSESWQEESRQAVRIEGCIRSPQVHSSCMVVPDRKKVEAGNLVLNTEGKTPRRRFRSLLVVVIAGSKTDCRPV